MRAGLRMMSMTLVAMMLIIIEPEDVDILLLLHEHQLVIGEVVVEAVVEELVPREDGIAREDVDVLEVENLDVVPGEDIDVVVIDPRDVVKRYRALGSGR
jgi:L-ascorbate metabolism protein UlaG (beta-lactamase superfamily)